MSFKVSIALSTFIHFAILCSGLFLQLRVRPDVSFRQIELTYFTEDEGLDKDTFGPTASINGEGIRNDAKVTTLEKIKIELAEASEIKITQIEEVGKDTVPEMPKSVSREAPESKIAQKEDVYTASKIPKVSKNEKSEIEVAETIPKNGTATLYEDYCLKVREKIKSILEKNRIRFTKEGEVCVRFIIDRNGALKDLSLYKSSSKNTHPLEKITIESIKQASPFMPFDDKMDEKELLFKLPIRFTYNQ